MDRKITPEMWEKIKQEYISSSVSTRDLAKKYGIPKNTLQRRSSKEGWVQQRKDVGAALVQRATNELIEEHSTIYDTAMRISEKLLAKIEMAVDEMGVESIGMSKTITGALKDIKEIGFYRAALDRQEQEARIRKLQKECEEEQKDTHITVTFAEGGDDYGD